MSAMANEASRPSSLERFVPILLLASIALAFMVGVLWQRVNNIENGTTAVAGTGTVQNNGAAAAPDAAPPNGKLTAEQAKNIPAVTDKDHVRGSRDAELVLIEYSDLECPFCKRFHPTVQQAMDEFEGKLAWVYRHYPLDQIHSKADKEAEAVECAAEVGGNDGFWKLTDKIYEVSPTNNGLDLAQLPALASEVGIDQAKFKSCLDSGKYAQAVEEQFQGGVKAGVQGTPGSFIINKNGDAWFISGAYPYDMLKTTIEEALQG